MRVPLAFRDPVGRMHLDVSRLVQVFAKRFLKNGSSTGLLEFFV